jgi:hypothetical protein
MFSFFGGASLTTKLIAGALAVSMLLGAWATLTRHYYNKGWYAGQDALQESIEKVNKEAATAAQERRNALDKCYDTGGTWDQSRGVCVAKR